MVESKKGYKEARRNIYDGRHLIIFEEVENLREERRGIYFFMRKDERMNVIAGS